MGRTHTYFNNAILRTLILVEHIASRLIIIKAIRYTIYVTMRSRDGRWDGRQGVASIKLSVRRRNFSYIGPNRKVPKY